MCYIGLFYSNEIVFLQSYDFGILYVCNTLTCFHQLSFCYLNLADNTSYARTAVCRILRVELTFSMGMYHIVESGTVNLAEHNANRLYLFVSERNGCIALLHYCACR